VRQVCTVSLSIAVALATVLMTVAVMVPRGGAEIAAASDSLAIQLRDLPTSVRAGDSLRVIVDVPDDTVCDGLITYRDNTTQTLSQVKQDNDRCQWDVVVPDAVRRGEADLNVTVNKGTQQAKIWATFDVSRRSDDIGLTLKKLPGAVKRNSDFSIRINVPDKSTCTGGITYDSGQVQTLDSRSEDNEQCRWDMTVPSDVDRGEARVTVTITTPDAHVSTLLTTFDVSRTNDNPDVLVAFQDPPTNVRQDGPMPIRVLVPSTATCKGEVTFRSTDNVKLDQITGESGICRWSIFVPKDAKKGESKISVTVTDEGHDTTITAPVTVQEVSDSVDANFKDLPTSVQRGDDLEVRISVPDGATCSGEARFDDGGVNTLAGQTEKKGRCLWNTRVPSFTPRGTIIVWAAINDHGVQSTLVSNVSVEGRDDDPVSATWDQVLKDVVPGQSFDVSASVAKGSTCVGKIEFAGGMQWSLGDKSEDDSHCKWRVDVPASAGAGNANILITVSKGKDSTILTSKFAVTKSDSSSTASSGATGATTSSAGTKSTPTPTPTSSSKSKSKATDTPTPGPTATTVTTATATPSSASGGDGGYTAPPPPQITLPTPDASAGDPGTDPAAVSSRSIMAGWWPTR
jgi:hypothetical protein